MIRIVLQNLFFSPSATAATICGGMSLIPYLLHGRNSTLIQRSHINQDLPAGNRQRQPNPSRSNSCVPRPPQA